MRLFKFRKSTFIIITILIVFSFSQPGHASVQPILTETTRSYSSDIGWQAGFVVNGTNKSPSAVVADGSKIYVGGNFSVAGGVAANNIAMWNGTNWTALGNGLNAPVQALATDGHGNLYVGGWFTEASGESALHVARWNGSGWYSLGGGLDGEVYAIAVDGAGRVYVGGAFTYAGGIDAQKIAMWDGTSWTALDAGVSSEYPQNSWVYSLTIDRFGFLYAGGMFTQAGGKPANNVARWDGATWESLGEGVKGSLYSPFIYTLAADNRGNVYAGGQFSTAGGINAENIARWNGETWSELGGGIQSGEKIKAAVISIVADGGNVYVGGNFQAAGGNPMGSIAKWNGTSWETLSGGVWQEYYSPIITGMAINRDGRIYTVGDFRLAGGHCADTVAAWDGNSWSGLGADTSVDGAIVTMIPDHHGGYYATGGFVCAGGNVVNHIAHWDGVTWSGLDSGLGDSKSFTLPHALALDGNGNLYVSGYFTKVGNIKVYGIAKWDGTSWESVGGDLDSRDYISMAIDSQNRLYIGGSFNPSHSVPPVYKRILRWNGSEWEEFGDELNNSVTALAFDAQDRLIAGGYFNLTGDPWVNGIARWNGQSWESLVTNCSDTPNHFLISGDTIYGGGYSVWKIENGNCVSIGGGLSQSSGDKRITFGAALLIDHSGRLVVGGQFTRAGQVEVNNIARWNGVNWENLGSGIMRDGSVYALSIDAGGNLLVAGAFSEAGGKVTRNLAIWHEPAYYWMPVINR